GYLTTHWRLHYHNVLNLSFSLLDRYFCHTLPGRCCWQTRKNSGGSAAWITPARARPSSPEVSKQHPFMVDAADHGCVVGDRFCRNGIALFIFRADVVDHSLNILIWEIEYPGLL